MQNSKLYSILRYFDRYEQNRLRKFLVSPYFNKNQALVQIFGLLVKHINSQKTTELQKESIWNSVYPSSPYDDVLFRKNCSDLLKLVERYLAQQVYEENPVHQATYLIEAIAKRKMERLNNTSVKSARRLSNQQLFRTADYYLHQYHIEKNYYELREHEHDRTARWNVEEILNNLDRFFLAEKLRYFCSVLSQQFIVSHEYELLFIEEIISHIEKFSYQDVPPVAVYYQIYLTQKEAENTDHYFKLIELLEKYGDLFPRNEAEFIYQAALNYCIKKINEGSQQFLEEYFNLFVILLQKEMLLTDGELSPWHFRNIVVAALRIGKYEWAENFIHDYKSFLPEAMRENAVSFNLAQLYFSQKKFEKVIELLRTVEYEDFTYNLNSKTMLLSTYYEMDEIEPLFSLLDSFRTYLNRHKNFPSSRRIPYNNLIKFTRKLARIIPGDNAAIKKLKTEIEKSGEGSVANITWLKEKIAELE
ncbi:MAG: hypothetical protein ACE5FF_15205 [Saprospiraceae bacterium]